MELINKTIKDYGRQLAEIFSLRPDHVEAALNLYKEDNTIPFIARYRKDLTGAMDDETLRRLFDEYKTQENLDERRNTIINTLNDLGVDDPSLEEKIKNAGKMTDLEDLYRPYKPKKQTRATVARDRGVEKLAASILALKSEEEIKAEAEVFLAEQKIPEGKEKLENFDQAMEAASDYLAGEISDNPDIRKKLKLQWLNHGILKTEAKTEEDSVYRLYYDFEEPLRKLKDHRLLAINRGVKEDFLKASIDLEERYWKPHIELILGVLQGEGYAKDFLSTVIDDAFKRLLQPSLDTEIMADLTDQAHEGALKIFGLNLKNALLVPPMKTQMVLALDPGYRNGCKWAVVNGQGTVMDAGLIFPVIFPNRLAAAKETMVDVILKYQVQTIVLGNGTASRETEEFLSDLLKENNLKVPYLIVDEAGASVYSASPISSEELPDMELNLRSAVSLARRVLDPLAELVKIDPKSIGVGQYQHDMNQKRLDEILAGVTEGVVNQVGVSLNTASPSLLSYVSGINKTTAKNIVAFREEVGGFKSRDQLKEVKRLGAKTFEQCAGFLRIAGGENPLDNTFVHPESYGIAKEMIDNFGLSFNKENKVASADLEKFAAEKNVGFETLQDIVAAISKPARDIRDDFPAPVLLTEVKSLEDLKEGQVLTGVVRNVTAFGAFVDLGVHQDGLIHISQMSDKFIKDPTTVVSVGDVVKVRVIEVDVSKKRIGLSLRNVN